MYIINCRFKLHLLTPLILPTLTPAVLNDFPTAEPPLLINITASFTDITAPFINVTAPPINVTAFSTEAKATTYGRDLVTLAKMYMEKSKYSGENNNFDCKLTIFNDLCNRVDIL